MVAKVKDWGSAPQCPDVRAGPVMDQGSSVTCEEAKLPDICHAASTAVGVHRAPRNQHRYRRPEGDSPMDGAERVLESPRWRRFMEEAAVGLGLNLAVVAPDRVVVSLPACCPRCGEAYGSLELSAAQATALPLSGSLWLAARACPCAAGEGGPPPSELVAVAAGLLRSLLLALVEGPDGGERAVDLTTLRQFNQSTLSLFTGEAAAVERALTLLVSALVLLLDAPASWLEYGGPASPRRIVGGDPALATDATDATDASDPELILAEARSGHVRCHLAVRGAADHRRAEALLPAMAQEALVVLEIERLFDLVRDQLARVLGPLSSAFMVLDPGGVIVHANAAAARLLGVPLLQLPGRRADAWPVPWASVLAGGGWPGARGHLDPLAVGQRTATVDWELVPLLDGAARSGWILRADDRTLEGEYRRALEELAHLETAAQMTRMLAHEIRNPLTVVRGLLSLIRSGHKPDLAGRYAEMATDEVDRVSHLLSEFLLLGKPAEMAAAPADLSRFVGEIMPAIEAALYGRGLVVVTRLGEPAPARFDPEQIRQLVLNLVRNAADAVDTATEPGGGRRIELAVERRCDGVVLSVHDSGPGIAEPDLAQIFEPEFTTKAHGTGLGLAVCQAVARHHGGRLTAENAPEGGARFSLWLPLVAADDPGPLPIILAIGDRVRRAALQGMLQASGASVRAAADLAGALPVPGSAGQPRAIVCGVGEAVSFGLERLRGLFPQARLILVGADSATAAQTKGVIVLPEPVEPARFLEALTD